jgi:hypothetical protein
VEFDTSKWGDTEPTLAGEEEGEEEDGIVANTNKRTFVESESENSDDSD